MRVDHAATASDGLRLALGGGHQAIVLDLGLPDRNGFTVIERLRRAGSQAPIVVLSGYADDRSMVQALDSGADDYVAKPVDGSLLVARIRAAIRRGGAAVPNHWLLGDITLDRITRRVSRAGVEVQLTSKEFALLELFVLRQGEVLTRTELLAHVWQMDFDPGSNVVDVQVTRLRQKLAPFAGTARIETIRGFGFTLTVL
jgi:two-component system copper resistance phosphate regulon response regulator CusR